MAREKFNLTADRLASFQCPAGTAQAFLWDLDCSWLALRVTAGGARAFIFQSRINGQTLRLTIGEPAAWGIKAARAEARRLQTLIDQGKDPRAEKAATIAQQAGARAVQKVERQRREVLGLDAWRDYCDDRATRWGARSIADHESMTKPGGEPRQRACEKVTRPGPLRALLARPLAEIDGATVNAWVKRETRRRPARAALGFRLLRAFLNWCSEHDEYRSIVRADACKSKKTREAVAKPRARSDVIQREQLPVWFAEVGKLSAVASAYLQTLLLTGARREEVMGLGWEDVDFRWQSLRIRDKVDGERVIPLTRHVADLLRDLYARNNTPPTVPRRLRADPEAAAAVTREWTPSPWVFGSRAAKSGRLQEPRIAHNRALAAAGLPHLTLHGLRRSFGTLSEWVECPVGIVAQIQGHRPSAIAEKHYRVRPLDLLRLWHQRIETWMLTEAGIEPPAALQAGDAPPLRVVGGTEA